MRVALIVLAVVIVSYVGLIYLPFDPDERRPGTRLSGDAAAVQDADFLFPRGMRAWVETRTWYLIRHSVTVTPLCVTASFTSGAVHAIPRCGQSTWRGTIGCG